MLVDVGERDQVEALAEKAKRLGQVAAVIHLAGLTPTFAPPELIMKVNALGPMYINEAFYKVMESGCIIDISSSAACYIPASMIPEETFKLSRSDKEEFYIKMMTMIDAVDEFKRQGMAYSLSRNFVQWYVKDCAFIFAQKGIRVLSVSPSLIDTDMSRQDMDKSGNGDVTLSYTGMGRTGVVDEIAFLFSALIDERNSYLTGIDILCDGGCYATGFRGQRVAKNQCDN